MKILLLTLSLASPISLPAHECYYVLQRDTAAFTDREYETTAQQLMDDLNIDTSFYNQYTSPNNGTPLPPLCDQEYEQDDPYPLSLFTKKGSF